VIATVRLVHFSLTRPVVTASLTTRDEVPGERRLPSARQIARAPLLSPVSGLAV
jgi:hypothetical protein